MVERCSPLIGCQRWDHSSWQIQREDWRGQSVLLLGGSGGGGRSSERVYTDTDTSTDTTFILAEETRCTESNIVLN